MEANRQNISDLGIAVICLIRKAHETKDAEIYNFLVRAAVRFSEIQSKLIDELEDRGLE